MEEQALHVCCRVFIGEQNICRGSLVWLGGPQDSRFIAVTSLHDFLGVHLTSFSTAKDQHCLSVMTTRQKSFYKT